MGCTETHSRPLPTAETRSARRCYRWTAELDALLERGYQGGLGLRQAATRKIQTLTGWPLQACWDRARKLGWSQKRTGFRRWSKEEEDFLLQYAGSRETFTTSPGSSNAQKNQCVRNWQACGSEADWKNVLLRL